MVFAAISTGGVIAIVVGAVSVIAGAFYALVQVQGERIKEARGDFADRIEALDAHIGTRFDETAARLEQRIDGLGDRMDARFDTLSARLDRVEEDLRATS